MIFPTIVFHFIPSRTSLGLLVEWGNRDSEEFWPVHQRFG